MKLLRISTLTIWMLCARAVCWAQHADSLHVSDLIAAESTIDSLRAEIRKLDRDIQSMKQDYVDGGEVDRLIEALGESEMDDPDAPVDTRSRRQRVDALLKAITQRPGQLRFNGGATVVAQDLVGGEDDDAAATGSFDLYAHTSFGPRTLLFFAFEVGGGAGLDGILRLGTSLNADAAPTRDDQGFDHLVLNEAWAEFTAFGDAVTLTAGKIDLTNYFDINIVANDETAQFLSGAFVNSGALLVPAPGPGVRTRTVLFDRVSVQGGLVSADSAGGTRFRDIFAIASVGMRVFPESAFDGNIRLYVYAPDHQADVTGWGMSIDQELGASVILFGRYGRNDVALVTDAIQTAWSTGLQWERAWRERKFVLAAAYGEARDAVRSVERTFEAYVSTQLNTWTYLSPHMHVVHDPADLPRTATALGVRVQFNF